MAAAGEDRAIRIAYAFRDCSAVVNENASETEIEDEGRAVLKEFLKKNGLTGKKSKLLKLHDEALVYFYEVGGFSEIDLFSGESLGSMLLALYCEGQQKTIYSALG